MQSVYNVLYMLNSHGPKNGSVSCVSQEGIHAPLYAIWQPLQPLTPEQWHEKTG